MTISLPHESFVNATYASAQECWFFQRPKVTIICGHCNGQFSTREWRTMDKSKEIVASCPVCGKWNLTKFHVKKEN